MEWEDQAETVSGETSGLTHYSPSEPCSQQASPGCTGDAEAAGQPWSRAFGSVPEILPATKDMEP